MLAASCCLESVMQRHFESLSRELKKKNPCATTVRIYLDAEFPRRRQWMQNLDRDNRVDCLIETYPCFKNYEEV